MRYVYKCNACGSVTEAEGNLTAMLHTMPLFCGTCLKTQWMKRQICQTSFVLKGGGWAKDGYAKTKE